MAGLFLAFFSCSALAEPSERLDLIALILNRVFSSIGRPRFEFRLDFKIAPKKKQIQNLNGRFEFPFRQSVKAIPLTSATTGDDSTEFSRVLPYLDIESQDLTVQWSVATFYRGGHQVLSNDIIFLDKNGQSVPLIMTTRSELTDFLQISIHGIYFEFNGIEPENGKVTVDGKCVATQFFYLDQRSTDFRAGKVGDLPVVCGFQGYVHKNKDDYEFNLTYDSRRGRD